MESFYLEIRTVHIASVYASGTLFLIRALAFNGFDARWPMAWPVRFLSYSIDTVLLTAALMLVTIVQQYPFVDAWLTVKVLLLVVYVTVGWFAFRSAIRGRRLALTAVAAAIFLFIISVARAHHPLGIFA